MGLRKALNKGKKVILGLALSSALLGAATADEANTEEIKDSKAKVEQPVDSKSEIKKVREKVGYLEEYLAAVERGEDKEEAYRRLTLKIADDNKEAAKRIQSTLYSMLPAAGGTLCIEALLIYIAFSIPKRSKVNKIDEKLGTLLKSKERKN